MHKFILFIELLLATAFSSVHAEELTSPAEISFLGKTYSLAYKNSAPDGRAIWEYTSNNEPIEKWSSLITINYAKRLSTSPSKWGEAVQRSLERQIPKPYFRVYTNGDNGYANFILEPSPKNHDYESNVHKSFHVESCGGLLVIQYAQIYPQGEDQSPEGKQSTLKRITSENSLHAEMLDKSEWKPVCR